MSFSFSAQGTRAETLASLRSDKHTGMTQDGQAVLELVTRAVEQAPAEGGDGRPVHFGVSASGHTGPGQLPFLTLTLNSAYQHDPVPPVEFRTEENPR